MKLNKSLTNIAGKYDDIILIRDLNIDFDNLKKGDTHSHLHDLCDTFSLCSLIKGITCVKLQNSISIDLMLTYSPRGSQNTSDYQKMMVCFFWTVFRRLPAKCIKYCSDKKNGHNEFLRTLNQEFIKGNENNDKQQYDTITQIFWKVLDEHFPLKIKILKEKQARFNINELRKTIEDQSTLRNIYLNCPYRENFLVYKKVKSICNFLNKKGKRDYLKRATAASTVGSRKFWNTVKFSLIPKEFTMKTFQLIPKVTS